MLKNIKQLVIADYIIYKKGILFLLFLAIFGSLCIYLYNFGFIESNLKYFSTSHNSSAELTYDAYREKLINNAYRNSISMNGVAYMVAIMVILSTSFMSYFSKKSAVQTYMLPATRSEKFWYILGVNCVVIPLVLFVIICGNHLLFASLYHLPYSLGSDPVLFSINVLLMQMGIISLFLFASIYFKRHQFLFAGLILFIGYIILQFIIYFLRIMSIVEMNLPPTESPINTVVFPIVMIGIVYSVWAKYKTLENK